MSQVGIQCHVHKQDGIHTAELALDFPLSFETFLVSWAVAIVAIIAIIAIIAPCSNANKQAAATTWESTCGLLQCQSLTHMHTHTCTQTMLRDVFEADFNHFLCQYTHARKLHCTHLHCTPTPALGMEAIESLKCNSVTLLVVICSSLLVQMRTKRTTAPCPVKQMWNRWSNGCVALLSLFPRIHHNARRHYVEACLWFPQT